MRIRARVSRPSRKFIWARLFISDAVTDLASPTFFDALDLVQTAIGADLIGSTIVRIRGNLLATNADATTGSTLVTAMRVMTTSTFAGLTQANGPATDENADWMMYEAFNLTASGNETYGSQRKEIDVRSSRKLEEVGQSLLFAMQGTTTSDVQTLGLLSLGLKLP